MKYYVGQCEVCKHSRPKPLDSTTFLCFAERRRKSGPRVDCDLVSKRKVAKRKCRFFVENCQLGSEEE